MNEIETKEVAVVKRQVTMALKEATAVVINSKESMDEAGAVRKRIKQVGALIKKKKDELLKPHKDEMERIKITFKPFETDFEKAEEFVSEEMLAYQEKVEKERRKAEDEANAKKAELDRKLAEGEITEAGAKRSEKALEKKLEKAPDEVKRGGSFHTRTVPKFRIIDRTKIPFELMMPNEVAIRLEMLAGRPVLGVEYYEDKIIV